MSILLRTDAAVIQSLPGMINHQLACAQIISEPTATLPNVVRGGRSMKSRSFMRGPKPLTLIGVEADGDFAQLM